MRIKTKTRQHRRDFEAVYECESCYHTVKARGYDDTYFHATVIPAMHCPECDVASGKQTSVPDVPAGEVL